MFDDTVPMPVSGGWAAFVAMTGAAFAPIAVTGGVSILACSGRESGKMKQQESSSSNTIFSVSFQNKTAKQE